MERIIWIQFPLFRLTKAFHGMIICKFRLLSRVWLKMEKSLLVSQSVYLPVPYIVNIPCTPLMTSTSGLCWSIQRERGRWPLRTKGDLTSSTQLQNRRPPLINWSQLEGRWNRTLMRLDKCHHDMDHFIPDACNNFKDNERKRTP